MTFRVQEEHFLGANPKVGDIIELRDCLSTSVTKDEQYGLVQQTIKK